MADMLKKDDGSPGERNELLRLSVRDAFLVTADSLSWFGASENETLFLRTFTFEMPSNVTEDRS
jgi:hypothetical protein